MMKDTNRGAAERQALQRREKAIALGEAEMPLAEICKTVGVNRKKVMRWLEDAGIEPVMLRKRQRVRGESLSNTPLALSIEEGVRKRVAAMKDEEDDDEAA